MTGEDGTDAILIGLFPEKLGSPTARCSTSTEKGRRPSSAVQPHCHSFPFLWHQLAVCSCGSPGREERSSGRTMPLAIVGKAPAGKFSAPGGAEGSSTEVAGVSPGSRNG